LFGGRVQSGSSVLIPILFGLLSGVRATAISLAGIQQIVLQLLVPFAAGQLSRPWIGQ
jgi:sodium/bile acid cotransporter 7